MKVVCSGGRRGRELVQAHAVFGIQVNVTEKWKDAKAGLARLFLKDGNTVAEKCAVAAKPIDEKRPHQWGFAIIQKLEGSDNGSKDSASVDVRHEHARCLETRGEAQIHQIVLLEIELGNASRSFDDDEIVSFAEASVSIEHTLEEEIKVTVVVAGAERFPGPSIQHHLASECPCGLQQDGIHVGVRLNAAGLCLCGLSSSDFAAVRTHGRVVGHVLGLERRHTMSHSIEIATQGRCHPALAYVGSGTADKNGLCR